MTRMKTLLAAVGLSLWFAGPGLALTVKHAQGELEIGETPKKVLVFDIASLDTLDALGVEVQGVPGGVKPAYLKKYEGDAYPKIGTLFEPDFEAVAAAQPDLIIVGGRSAAKFGELSRIGPTIDLTPDRSEYLASAKRNVETLASIFGKEAEAKTRLDALDASVAQLREEGKNAGTVLVMLTAGNRMSAHGPGSRFGVIYDDYGLTPAAEGLDTGNHGQAISPEFIAEKNPDWLFVVDRDAAIGREGSSARQTLDNELVHKTKAWQNEHVVYLDPAGWYLVGSGLTAMKNNLDQIVGALSAK